MEKKCFNEIFQERNTLANRSSNSDKWARIYGIIFRIMLFVIVSIALLASYVMPREEEQTFYTTGSKIAYDEESVIFNGEFYRVYEDGHREKITLPGKYSVQRGEPLVVESTLPADYDENAIIIRSSQQNLRIYVDDVLRADYDTKETRPMGTQTTSRYVVCKTSAADAGKTFRIETLTNAVGYSGRINKVYACNEADFWKYMLKKNERHAIIAIVIFLLGVFTVGVSYLLAIGFNHRFGLEYLGWLIAIAGGWQLASSEMRQLFVPNVSILSYMEFILLMIAPIPLALYINGIQQSRYKKLYLVVTHIGIINFVIQIILQVLNIANFIDMLLASHIVIILAVIVVVITFILDIKRKKIYEYRLISISMAIFMLCAVAECLSTYVVNFSEGHMVALGTIQFVAMALYQTIADVRVLEGERRRDKAEKIEADNANRAKSQFLANMSHEIRTPINAVMGMNEMILRKTFDSDIKTYAENIQGASNTLLTIINDILDFSKIESGKMELVTVEYEIANVISDIYNIISIKAREKSLELVLDIDENIPCKLLGDDVRIRQIVINLLTNAVKYTHSGTITLKISKNQNVRGIKDNEASLFFAVKDTGIGIKPEDISKLTEEFVRIEESRNRNIEGTGLGINIVGSLLNMMGSKLEVESVYGEGSTFFFNLVQPVVDSEPIGDINERMKKVSKGKRSYKSKLRIPNARLLIVDDTFTNRLVFVHLLKELKCHIDEADSGIKCLELVRENKYDLIFMDHMMPKMDGIETFEHMREMSDGLNANTPVVILTANAINGAREEYLDKGFADYLSKPIDSDKLEEIIDRLIPDDLKE